MRMLRVGESKQVQLGESFLMNETYKTGGWLLRIPLFIVVI